MIAILVSLEPRHYNDNLILYEELDNVMEMKFVMKGSFRVGYEINKTKRYRLLFGPGSTIGGFNCLFNKPTMFIYKCVREIEGYGIRKKSWIKLDKEFPDFSLEVKSKVYEEYYYKVRIPIVTHKYNDFIFL